MQVDQTNVTSKENAALQAWALVNDLYSGKNVSGGGASVAPEVRMGDCLYISIVFQPSSLLDTLEPTLSEAVEPWFSPPRSLKRMRRDFPGSGVSLIPACRIPVLFGTPKHPVECWNQVDTGIRSS